MAGLSAIAAPASATTTVHALPGVALEKADQVGQGPRQSPDFGVTASVTRETRLFEIDLTFPLVAPGLDCTNEAHRTAEFRWTLVSASPAGPNDGSGDATTITQVSDLCAAAGTDTLTELHVSASSNTVNTFAPDQYINVLAEIENAGTSSLPMSGDPGTETLDVSQVQPKLSDLHYVGRIQMPKAPVWVGIGDGYTSAAYQGGDCALTDTLDDCFRTVNGEDEFGNPLGPDVNFLSWIQYSATTIQAALDMGEAWTIQPRIVATMDASGADLLDEGPGSQIAQLRDALAGVKGAGIQPDSWNWVGVSAGLNDGGVRDILDAWYPTNAPTPEVGYPWEIDGAPVCPSYASVPTTVAAARAALQDGLLNAFATAFELSDNLRIVQLLYPYFVDEDSPCRAEVVAAVDAINAAVAKDALLTRIGELGGVSPVAADDLVRLNDVALNDAFEAAHPTGLPVGTDDDIPTAIQLTKPYGYPHLSLGGAEMAGLAAAIVLEPPRPPTVTASVALVNPADGVGAGFFRGPVRISYVVSDPADPSAIFNVPPTILTAQGLHTDLLTPAGICSQVSGLCALRSDIQDVKIDSLAPAVDVKYYNAAGTTPVVPGAGVWFNDAVTVEWFGLHDHAANAQYGQVSGYDDPSKRSTPVPRPRTTITQEGANIKAVAPQPVCDFAGNCATVDTYVNIDKRPPVISGHVPGTPVSGWFSPATWPASPRVVWTVSDAHPTVPSAVSGVDPTTHTDTPLGTPVQGPNPPVTKTVTDRAGNVSQAAQVVIRYDSVKPTATLVELSDPNSPDTVEDGDVLDGDDVTLSCSSADPGADAGTGSGVDTCEVTNENLGTDGGYTTWRYTIVVTDVAGNTATTVLEVQLPEGVNVNTPPATEIVSGPTPVTSSTTAVFAFTGTDEQDAPADLRYECSLDGAPFAPCTATTTYNGLADGEHTLLVRAVDTGDLEDPEPVEISWLVDTIDPVVPVSDIVNVDGDASGAEVDYSVVATDPNAPNGDPGSGIDVQSCTPPPGPFPLGVTTVTCTATDRAGNSTTVRFKVTVGAQLGGGRSFVIGDLSDNLGSTGYYWGSQWWKAENNRLSKEPKPPAFKGYANRMGTNGAWFTDPGNSSVPPSSVPSYLVVIVASDVNKNGAVISGDTVAYAIIKTQPGYGPAPGHVGEGQIIAVLPA